MEMFARPRRRRAPKTKQAQKQTAIVSWEACGTLEIVRTLYLIFGYFCSTFQTSNRTHPPTKKTARTKAKALKAKSSKAKPTNKPSKAKARARALKSNAPSKRERRSAEELFAELKLRLLEISDLGAVGAVLGWDEAT